MGKDDLKSYVITETNGARAIILEKEIVNRKKANLAFVDLDEPSRREVMRQRSISAAKHADGEAQAAELHVVNDAKLKESARKAEFDKKLSGELALARDVLTNAEQVIKNTPVDIARADARYEFRQEPNWPRPAPVDTRRRTRAAPTRGTTITFGRS